MKKVKTMTPTSPILSLPDIKKVYDEDLNRTVNSRIVPLTTYECAHLLAVVADGVPQLYKTFPTIGTDPDPIEIAKHVYKAGYLDNWIVDRSAVGGGIYTVGQLKLPNRFIDS